MRDRKVNKTRDQAADRPYELIHILSDINRMQILRLLADSGELCARDILANFPITQPTLSHHMSVLLENNLVESRKSGRWVFYSVSKSGIQEVINFFETIKNSAGNPIEKTPVKPVSAPVMTKAKPSKKNVMQKPLSPKPRDVRSDDWSADERSGFKKSPEEPVRKDTVSSKSNVPAPYVFRSKNLIPESPAERNSPAERIPDVASDKKDKKKDKIKDKSGKKDKKKKKGKKK